VKALATALIVGLPALAAERPAFPGVAGAGMFTSGGRGGTVVHVRNLNADGPGSLAEAVTKPNRIVVFDVSGIIDLSPQKKGKAKGGRIDIEQPNITIAGQTAPGEGICIKGGCLTISAGNVIVRHIRSRRGWNFEGDTGDAIEVKPLTTGEAGQAAGQTELAFDKRAAKKAERGKFVHAFAPLTNIVIDHCSTSWATDENLTATHADRTTVSWSIAAEGCDYANPKQTPPNHSEGSLWGSGAPDGRATMHHMLYAHNRLRNPRTTGGADQPPILTFYNNVVYDWSEYATHTGSERVLLDWLDNYYKPGPSTPAEIRTHAFEFHGDAGARIFAQGNFIDGAPEVTANNKLGIFHNEKFRKMPAAEKEAMKVDAPFGEAPRSQRAQDAFEAVLADAGATLPARDAVDLRVVNGVRRGSGKIIEKETDLAENERWPEYRSLPPPKDSDGDGLPDFWEKQFGLDSADAGDSAKPGAGGYANIEHYFNNTDPAGRDAAIVHVAATVSRAAQDSPGEWQVTRSGDRTKPLTVSYSVTGDAAAGRDYEPLAGKVTIAAGESSAAISLRPRQAGRRMVVLTLDAAQPEYRVGCPSASLVVIGP
jgi:pectate lyase